MKVVVVSPENDRADEHGVLDALFSAGLDRLHVRKPHASHQELACWIERIPVRWRSRVVLHQHHDLVDRYQLGGRHWRDDRSAATPGRLAEDLADDSYGIVSRSCHDVATLRSALGVFDSVFFGPAFPSVSKPGYGPRDANALDGVRALLQARASAARRTAVIAIGGITVETAPRALALGFDGVAVLGAVWQAADPVSAFERILALCRSKFICDPANVTSSRRIADKPAPTASALSS